MASQGGFFFFSSIFLFPVPVSEQNVPVSVDHFTDVIIYDLQYASVQQMNEPDMIENKRQYCCSANHSKVISSYVISRK